MRKKKCMFCGEEFIIGDPSADNYKEYWKNLLDDEKSRIGSSICSNHWADLSDIDNYQ